MENKIVKIGITPSNAPFRVSCLRTFSYIYAFAEKNALNGNNSKIIFQIDDTNKSKRLHSNEEIIEFYKKINFLPAVNSKIVISQQTDITDKCEYYYNQLKSMGFIIENKETGVSGFNIQKFKSLYGQYINVNDELKGNLTFEVEKLTENGIINIRRSDGTYLYNYAAAIDAITWNLTDIIRGNNKMSSAAYQNMIIKSLGYKCPNYIHLPLLLEEINSNYKVNAFCDIRDLLNEGFSYIAVINYILLTGYGAHDEHYTSFQQFCENFDLKKIHNTNSHFDYNLLKKMNNRYFESSISLDDYKKQLKTHCELKNISLDVLNLADIGHRLKLNNEKLIQLYSQMNDIEYMEPINGIEKEQAIILLSKIDNGIDKVMEEVLLDKNNKKQRLEILKWILCGYKNSLSCSVYKEYYKQNEEQYRKRLEIVRRKIC